MLLSNMVWIHDLAELQTFKMWWPFNEAVLGVRPKRKEPLSKWSKNSARTMSNDSTHLNQAMDNSNLNLQLKFWWINLHYASFGAWHPFSSVHSPSGGCVLLWPLCALTIYRDSLPKFINYPELSYIFWIFPNYRMFTPHRYPRHTKIINYEILTKYTDSSEEILVEKIC